MCSRLSVFLQTNYFKDGEEALSRSTEVRFPFPTSSTLEIVDFAVAGLKRIYEPCLRYKRAGVTLYDFTDEDQLQPFLFDEMNSDPRHKKLMDTIDAINRDPSSSGVRLASQDVRRFKMHQQHLSKKYTTDIREILEVKNI